MTNAEYISPDGLLRFLVQTATDDVVCLGFDGFLWHKHPDELPGTGHLSEGEIVERYVRDLLENRLVIAVWRDAGLIVCAWVTDDPVSEMLHVPPDVELELRYWDGSRWEDATAPVPGGRRPETQEG